MVFCEYFLLFLINARKTSDGMLLFIFFLCYRSSAEENIYSYDKTLGKYEKYLKNFFRCSGVHLKYEKRLAIWKNCEKCSP